MRLFSLWGLTLWDLWEVELNWYKKVTRGRLLEGRYICLVSSLLYLLLPVCCHVGCLMFLWSPQPQRVSIMASLPYRTRTFQTMASLPYVVKYIVMAMKKVISKKRFIYSHQRPRAKRIQILLAVNGGVYLLMAPHVDWLPQHMVSTR